MLKRVVAFFVVYICLVKSAILIEEETTTGSSKDDVSTPETINDISFGSLIDSVTDFIKSERNADNMVEAENDREVENSGNSEGSSFGVSLPNFDFDFPAAVENSWNDDDYSYYYDDDDNFIYADDTSYGGPQLNEPPNFSNGGETITIEFPNFGSIFNPPPQVEQPFTDTPSSVSHPASDASVSSAVNSMFSTPHSDEYQEVAYTAMTRVRSECKADFDDICTPKSFPSLLGTGLFSLLGSSLFTPFMFDGPMFSMVPRTRRLLQGEPVDRVSFMNRLKEHVNEVKAELGRMPHLKPKLDDMASKFAAFRNSFPNKKLQHTQVITQDAAAQVPPMKAAPLNPLLSNHLKQGEMMHPIMANFKAAPNLRSMHPVNRHLDETQSIQNSPQLSSHHRHNKWGSPEGDVPSFGFEDNHPWEDADENYNGELLWGPIGDRCMYDNFDDLSKGCQDAITDVYVIRDQYIEEDNDSHGCNLAIFIFFIVTIFVVAFIRRKARLAKYEKDLAMYNAMQENPALKEQMEKSSGVVMDKPKMCASSCGMLLLRVILSFLSALLALQFSFFVTILVVERNITYDQFGNEVMPPPILPFLTFFASLLAATAMMLCIHQHCFGKKKRRQQQPELQPATSVPSPPASSWNLPDMRFAWPTWTTRARPSNHDYAVLAGESVHGNHGNEMVVITPSAPAPQAVVVQQTYPSTAAVMSPVNII